MATVRVTALADLPEIGSRAFEVAGRSVLLCRSSAGLFALENMCSHAFSRLEEGKVKGPHIFCPLHGIRFDMRTGEPNGTLTKQRIAVFPVSIENDAVFVEMP